MLGEGQAMLELLNTTHCCNTQQQHYQAGKSVLSFKTL